MKTSKRHLLAVLNDFSRIYNVTPPQTDDIGVWWKNAITQMAKWEIQLYYIAFKRAIENGVLNGEISKMMLNELENSNLINLNEKQYI